MACLMLLLALVFSVVKDKTTTLLGFYRAKQLDANFVHCQTFVTQTILIFFGSFVGESMHDDSSMVFAYYREGATDPTFLYFAYGLREVKC